jgi:hypothetical protein
VQAFESGIAPWMHIYRGCSHTYEHQKPTHMNNYIFGVEFDANKNGLKPIKKAIDWTYWHSGTEGSG